MNDPEAKTEFKEYETQSYPRNIRPTGAKGPRVITITPALNGFIVQIGCQTVVFKGLTTLLDELYRYYYNPREVEREYLESGCEGIKKQPRA